MVAITGVCSQADAVLDQCSCFIESVSDDKFAVPSTVLAGGTIGKHIRHTLDHYKALMEGHANSSPVDYDHRTREVPIETDRAAASEAVADLRARIAGLDEQALGKPVCIRVMISADGSETELQSTLARELAFASHHAIHHNAMMKAIAQELAVECSDGFGVAPSTLEYQARS
jgi:uncharacterized damage-inducible protein DinB